MFYLETAFLKVFNMSITASYVIVSVLLIRLCIRKIPKIFSYVLWSVTAFRLVCPISFSSIISIFNLNLFDMSNAQKNGSGTLTYVPPDIGHMNEPRITVGIPVANSYISESLPAAPMSSVNPIQIAVSVAAILWCLGIAAMIIYSVVSCIKVKRMVANGVLAGENIYECDKITSPFVFGLIRLKICIPFRMNYQQREYILRHEQYHIRRLDHIIKPLSFLLLGVYWFNPLVWIAYLCMCTDMEMSCDEKVLSEIGATVKKDYSMSLLALATKHSFPAASPLAFGEANVKERVKNVLSFKKQKTWIIALSVILIIGAIIACVANPVMNSQKASDISGYYEFEENIYTSLLSSFLPFKGHMPYYEISEKSLKIIDNKDGSVQQEFPGVFKKEPLDRDNFESMFEFDINIPDISKYKECYQYAVFSSEGSSGYCLYVMDDEVWLANHHSNNAIWSIYRLVKTDGVKPGADGLFVVPSPPPIDMEEGYQLEIWFGKEIIDLSFINDAKSIGIIEDIILHYNLISAGGENVDLSTVGDYFRFYDATGENSTLYYAFINEAIEGKPQMQTNKGSFTRIDMPGELYESLYILWEKNMALPDSITAKSGDNTVSASVYRQNEKLNLKNIKEQISWLKIDPKDDYCPFRVYLGTGSEQIYGHYEIYAADSLEKLEFVRSSGLEPQTHILKNAQSGRSYIVQLSTGYMYSGKNYGMKILFGVTLP